MEKEKIKFMDFCAGIGAGRIGCENNGFNCVGFSEIDYEAEKTYRLFFGYDERNYGDLMKIDTKVLPDFDFMIAGFPCQTFSIVGKRKGFGDARGQIIFGLVKILKEKNIKYFLFENVKGLTSHKNGDTIKEIESLLNQSGYYVKSSVLNSKDFGVPQSRERVYFVGIRKDLINDFDFEFPKISKRSKLENFLIDERKSYIFNSSNNNFGTFIKYLGNNYNKDNNHNPEDFLKYDFTILDTRQSDLRIYKDYCPTLRTGRHGIMYIKNNEMRKISGYEALLLQGFPDKIAKKTIGLIADSKLLSQAGNAMTVKVIEEIVKELFKKIL